MFDRIMRSFELVKASWQILMDDKKLLVFPILSGIVTLLVIASFVVPIIFYQGASHFPPTPLPASSCCSSSTWSATLWSSFSTWASSAA